MLARLHPTGTAPEAERLLDSEYTRGASADSYGLPLGATFPAICDNSGLNVMAVAVFGLGYIGCVTAACFARLGHQVVGIDLDPQKVASVNAGRAPFFEPSLDEIVRDVVAQGRLRATTSPAEAIAATDIAFVCVGTPSEANGNLGLDQLRRVVLEFKAALEANPKEYVIAIRSTVFPGTCEEVVIAPLAHLKHVSVGSNPEFLREGSAVRDFLEPALIVVGGDEPAASKIAALYDPIDCSVSAVSLRTAEMIKYACNAYHAVKICFANEVDALSSSLGVNGAEVMQTLCLDDKLNISKAYLKPGPAFGGSCLPKDLRALNYRASRLDLKLPLLGSALPSNDAHLERGIRQVVESPGGRIGVFGLSFKENTDDLRESPVIVLLERLIGKGMDVRVYDPHIRLDDIYGSNRNFLLDAIPHIARLLDSDFDQFLASVDQIVVTQRPSAEDAERLVSSNRPIINLAGAIADNLTTSAVSAL